HFTMDNAENNRTCIKKLGELLAEWEFEIVFDPNQRRVMCHPHLINLCTKHACEGFTSVDASEIEHNITTDTVKRHSNTEKYTPVNECWQEQLSHLKLLPTEWLVLSDFECILSATHIIQHTMSSKSQLQLRAAVPMFELLISSWEKLAKDLPRLKPWVDHALGWVYTYYQRMNNRDVYILAMFVDPATCLAWIKCAWDTDHVMKVEELVLNMMSKYHEVMDIRGPVALEVQAAATNSIDSIAQHLGLGSLGFNVTPATQGVLTIKQEYDKYVSVEREQGNPLVFWRTKRSEFPTIFQIVMDYLPVQASSVLCEHVFSSSAETDTKRCNRIGPILMEVLQMLKFERKKWRLNFTKGWAPTTVSSFKMTLMLLMWGLRIRD
ncbi:hypothetical protein SCLCIDRAFT_111706, partial [Scleroderma citrinum Foug A]